MSIKDKKISQSSRSSHAISWEGLSSGDEGQPMDVSGYSDKSVQFSGVFGTEGVAYLEGSNDGVNFFVLTDPQGNGISKNTSSIEKVVELTQFVRPKIVGGNEHTNINVHLFVKLEG